MLDLTINDVIKLHDLKMVEKDEPKLNQWIATNRVLKKKW